MQLNSIVTCVLRTLNEASSKILLITKKFENLPETRQQIP